MKLYLNDAIQKPVKCYLNDLEVGQIFIDDDGDYCMKIVPEEAVDGSLLTIIVLSGVQLGTCYAYKGDSLVIPVEAELNVIKYE